MFSNRVNLNSSTPLAGKFKLGGTLVTALILGACSIQPKPLEKAEVADIIEADRQKMFLGQEAVTEPLSMYDVMARAVLYNLEHRTSRMEKALANGELELAKFDLLPVLTTNGSYVTRNNTKASTSASILTGQPSGTFTTLEDRSRWLGGARFSWNVLDFGVSYIQAKQQANRVLLSEMDRRKVLMAVLQQARSTYWRALAAQRMGPAVERSLLDAKAMLDNLDRGMDSGAFGQPLDALKTKKGLLELISQLEILQKGFEQATASLKSLINVPLNQDISLEEWNGAHNPLPKLDTAIENLENMAMMNSTDLHKQIYEARIFRDESRKALLRLLPGLEIGGGANYDSNSFLLNNDWLEAEARVTWNLMRIASAPTHFKVAKLQKQVSEQKRLAVGMAVLTRVNLSVSNYHNTLLKFSRAEAISDVGVVIADLTAAQQNAQSISKIASIEAQAQALRSRLAAMQAYVEAEDSYGELLISIGVSPLPAEYALMPVGVLSEIIEEKFAAWRKGDIVEADSVAFIASF